MSKVVVTDPGEWFEQQSNVSKVIVDDDEHKFDPRDNCNTCSTSAVHQPSSLPHRMHSFHSDQEEDVDFDIVEECIQRLQAFEVM